MFYQTFKESIRDIVLEAIEEVKTEDTNVETIFLLTLYIITIKIDKKQKTFIIH